MTTPWNIERQWDGKTVAVLASGPSMTAAVVEALAVHKCIAVNYTANLAPAVDMLVALDADPVFWGAVGDFAGMRVCGVDIDTIDALYAGPLYERFAIAPGHEIEIRNSGLAAIRIAARMGAARVILAGFDPETPTHFEGRPNADLEEAPAVYSHLAAALASIVAELRAAGVEVEYFEPAVLIQNAAPAVELAPRRPRSKVG